eukprot:366449-Chlamydomonas_euryale.AAC.1
MGWDGMGWDGMGWDGMGWDGIGRDEMDWSGWDRPMTTACVCNVIILLASVFRGRAELQGFSSHQLQESHRADGRVLG